MFLMRLMRRVSNAPELKGRYDVRKTAEQNLEFVETIRPRIRRSSCEKGCEFLGPVF
jgi:hypothetical protein